MKRKIFQTKYGRLILKIQTQHREKYISIFILSLDKTQFKKNELVGAMNINWKFQFPNRYCQERFSRVANQERAEQIAEILIKEIPNSFKP